MEVQSWLIDSNVGYLGLIGLGGAISLATFFALLFLARKEKRKGIADMQEAG